MEKDESPFVDYGKPLPDDLDEHTKTLLKLAKMYVTARKILAPSIEEIARRSKEKEISPNRAKRELVKERQPEHQKLVKEALKNLSPRLSKEEREKLGIKGVGRPIGKKNKNVRISKTDLFNKLRLLAKSANQMGEELNQEMAAEALGLGGTRQLRRLLREYGDVRKWKDILNDLLI